MWVSVVQEVQDHRQIFQLELQLIMAAAAAAEVAGIQIARQPRVQVVARAAVEMVQDLRELQERLWDRLLDQMEQQTPAAAVVAALHATEVFRHKTM
jgi:hypothetical protein